MKRKTITGLAVFVTITLVCFITPLFIEDSSAVNVSIRLQSPSLNHPMGTDTLGRDLLSRVLEGGRVSISIGLATALISSLAGLAGGLVCMTGRLADTVIMRICDVFKALPSTLMAILFMVLSGGGADSLIPALCIVSIPQSVRIVRSRAAVVMSESFIQVQRALGIGRMRILFTSVVRHVTGVLIVQALFVFSSSILAEAGLSFIGAGLSTDTSSWGSILNEGRGVIYQAWWMIVFPSVFIFLSLLSLNMIADGLKRE